MTSWACLVVSGLKFIFHWVAVLLILSKSWCKTDFIVPKFMQNKNWYMFTLDSPFLNRELLLFRHKFDKNVRVLANLLNQIKTF